MAGPLHARALDMKVARVSTPVARAEGVEVRLDWPADAAQGALRLRAQKIVASDLGYRFERVDWQCLLQRDGAGGWRCQGPLRAGGGPAMQLDVHIAPATTDATLSQRNARLGVHRSAATPDLTRIEFARVPVAWLQALSAQAWPEGRLTGGTLDGALDVATPSDRPLRVAGTLQARAVGIENTDATIAGEGLGARLAIDYRKTPAATLLGIDGDVLGGQFLAGNTYVALPPTPVAIRVDAMQRAGQGWDVPTFAWRDGDALSADGSAAFDPAANLRALDLSLRSGDLSPVRERYLSGQLALAGLGDLDMRGRAGLRVQVAEGRLSRADLSLEGVDVQAPGGRFGFEGLYGGLRFATAGQVDSALGWRGGTLYGLRFGAARLPVCSRDGVLAFQAPVTLPMMGGTLRFEDVAIRPPAGEAGLDMRFALLIDGIDFGQVSQTVGLPAFQGTLSGRIPRAHYANEWMDFDGGLSMRLFDGRVDFSALSLERPFGTAPSLSANIAFEDLDLLRLTEVLDVGSITGRLDGRIVGLRLVDWTPVAFDARFDADPAAARAKGAKQRISQRAVQNISSVGDASFVSSLQGRLIGLFDDFGYARLGIGCRLVNEVCRMSGLDGAGSENNAFTIVAGAGIPRLDVVGYNRDVAWPTLVERLAAVGKGEVKPVFE